MMKKESFMKQPLLESWEQDLSNAIERGEFVSAHDAEEEKEYLQSLASSFLKKRKISISVFLNTTCSS
jgi:hypothetical protein